MRPDPTPPPASLVDRLGRHFPGHVMQRMRLPDGRYRYTYVSPGVRETFGLDADALRAADGVAHDWLPEPDRGRFVAALEHSAATLQTLDEEVRVIRPDGSVRWVRSIGHPRRLADGSVIWDGVALDVTDRHEARAALDAALEAARRREVSGAGLSAIAFADLARPLAQLREALAPLPGAAPALVHLAEVEAALASAAALARAAPEAGEEDPPGLTPRQAEILGQVRLGRSNRDIAAALGLREGTVKLHVSALLRRLGARNRTEAALRR